MGNSSSAPGNQDKTVVLYYLPWRNEDVWQSFAALADRGVPGVSFRMVNVLREPSAATAYNVTTFPTLVCSDGSARIEYIRNLDASFSALMRWIHS